VLRKVLSCAFLFGLCGASFGAFTIEPALVNIQVNAGENSAWVELVHTGGGPMAIEMKAYERPLTLDGELDQSAMTVTKDFIVHPTEIILMPGEQKRVQVLYKGKQKINADRAYLLFSKEVPIKIAEDGSEAEVKTSVTMLMNYYTILACNTGKPGKLTFVSSKPIDSGKIEVIVENKSGGRVPGEGLVIRAGKDRITEFTGKKNSIMPGQKRRFTFKRAKPLTEKEVSFGG